jgi:hypothetical protein
MAAGSGGPGHLVTSADRLVRVGGSQLLGQGVGQQFSSIKHDLPFLM